MYDDYYDDTHRYNNVRPNGLAIDPGGDLLVLDDSIGRVVRIPAGADVGIGLPLKVVAPGGIAVDSAGAVYVTSGGRSGDDARVVKLPAGASEGIDLPFRRFSSIYRGIAVDHAGDVLTSEYWSATVQRLAAGEDAPTNEPFTGLAEPEGLAVDVVGDVYVADTGNNRIVKVAYPCVGWQCALRGLQLIYPPELRPCLFLPLLCNPCGPFGLCLPPEFRGR
jgi:serine/threonine-protein kinase